MAQTQIEPSLDRRAQILDAAVVCFAKRGFHQASMHDISAEAGISVGLIYRYFENKEAVISAMADRHKNEIQEVLERARQAPTLLESLEILFTAHCCEELAEGAIGVRGRSLRGSVAQSANRRFGARCFADGDGWRDRFDRAIAGSEKAAHGLTPHEQAELIFAVARGMLMRDVLQPQEMTAAERRARQLEVTRRLWRLLFKMETEPAYA